MTIDLWRAFKPASGNPLISRRAHAHLHASDILHAALQVKAQATGSRDPAFLYCEDGANFLAGLIGLLSAGRPVMLPGHTASGYLAEIGVRPQTLFTDMPELSSAHAPISVTPEATANIASIDLPDDASDIGFFTSGTTGDAKPCLKRVSQLRAEVETHLQLWGAPEGLVLGTVSHQHIYGMLFRLLWPLAAMRPFKAECLEVWEAVDHFFETSAVLISSPAHLSRIPHAFHLKHKASAIFSSGGPLSLAAAKESHQALGCWPIEVLGSTETGGVAWRRQNETPALWQALPGIEITSDEEGALAIRSPFTGTSDLVRMGDEVIVAPDGRFELRPRLDRIVKIEGKRVALQRVEAAIGQLEEIADVAAIDLPDRRGALGAIIVLTSKGKALEEELGKFRLSRHLRHSLSKSLEPMERPRFWRSVEVIPQNKQGKKIASELRRLFSPQASSLPIIREEVVAPSQAVFELELNPDLPWFEGHFPGRPILPGVAQLHIACELAEKAWGFVPTGHEMSRIKFRHVMQPGDRITLTLVRKAEDRLDFEYVQNDEVMASGAIKGEV